MVVITVDHHNRPEGGTTFQRGQTLPGALMDGQTFFDTDLQQLLVYSATNSRWQTWTGAVAGSTKAGSATVAATGTVLGNAAVLTPGLTLVTGANGTKGVILPVGTPGMESAIANDAAANAALKVYPQINAAINLLGANNAISMAANAACRFLCDNAALWLTWPNVPS